ncbi:MAG TPA: DUF1002 domain-containing protein [Pseudogracilibacillus sp.]|nr:DUF1002 domain-containing protein [Pseudogracilibacillus sp.]
MMKRMIMLLTAFTLILGFTLPTNHITYAVEISEDLKGESTVVYGANLTAEQKEEVRRLLEADSETMEEYVVTGEDIYNYIGGDRNSRMFSSVKITHEKDGHGIVVNIVTPDRITEVTSEMYSNALLTAGVEDATVEVAAPKPVTGGSALAGIYKAYDAVGAELDKGRMEVANDELDLTTKLSEKDGLSQDTVTDLMTEIKKSIAEQNPATREDVEEIVQEQLDRLEISLSEEDRQLLIDLFERMRELDIDFGKVKEQLEELTTVIKDRLGDLDISIDEGFWNKVKNFFNDLIDKIASLFNGKD